MRNWIADQNPFHLAAPPAWFLQQLHDRDADLVLLPGLTQPVYRLARRVTKSLGLVKATFRDSETSRMVTHKLIPVTSILGTIQYWPDVLAWLDAHDTWAVGGGEKADDILLAQEAAAQARLQRAQVAESDARSGSAYRSLKLRTGQTIFVSHAEGASPS